MPEQDESDARREGSQETIEFPFGDSSFIDLLATKFPHPLQRAIMPVVLERDGELQVAGTGFSVMSGVALTATHVLFDGKAVRGDPAYLLYMGGTNADGSLMGGLLPIQKVTLNQAHDIALVRYAVPRLDDESLRVAALALSFAPPVVGSACLAIGYTAGTTVDVSEAGLGVVTIAPKLHASKGQVEELVIEGVGVVRHPVFRMDALIVSQMSGSPVASGGVGQHRVVGLVRSSFGLAAGEPPISHASLLAPALGLSLPFDIDGVIREVTLGEMAARGGVDAQF